MRSVSKFIIILLCLLSLALPAQSAARAQAEMRIGVFEPLTTTPDAVVEVPVRVEGAVELFAVDLEIRFDPAVAIAEDADPSSPGVQMGLANFLDPGLVLYNEVDNGQGVARFVMTQVNPSEPKSGSGILLVLYLRGVQAGQSALTVASVLASDRAGLEIPVQGVNATLTVAASAPSVQATATPIPVVNPTEMMWIPTLAPSPTPQPTTALQAATLPAGSSTRKAPTPLASATAFEQFIPAVEQETGAQAQAESTPWLVKNWWIVLAAALVAAGLGYYLYRTR